MKKITLIIALFFITLESNAQVLLSENFDTALNWTAARMSGTSTNAGWSRQTNGTTPSCTPFAGAGMARFYSYNIAVGNTYRLTSPAISFGGATYRVKFQMYRDGGYPTDADKITVYYNTTATTVGGTILGTVNRSIGLAPTVSAEGWYAYSFDLPANVTGDGYISLLATSAYGNNIFVDSISVIQVQSNDVEISTLNLNEILGAAGNTTISGTIKNVGINTLNAVDLKWQADSGPIYTQSLSGLNLATGQSYTYNHPDQWSATPGLYAIKVWVEATDTDLTNNEILKSISVASNATTRQPLYEKFSSSTCPPCATFNTTYFTPFYNTNGSNLNLISYQVNWPGSGDPYFTTEVGTRVAYYGVSGAPTLFVDAKDGTNFNTAGLQADLNAANVKPSYFVVNATEDLVGTDLTVNVDVTPYLTGTYKLHAVVVEKITTGNIASNGETSFKHVMMKMLPNASGTTLNCVFDTALPTITLQADLSSLNIEEFTDLEVIVFIQSTTNRSIMQSGVATPLLSNNNFKSNSKFKLSPNPSEGIVRINSITPVDVIVSDITGKVVFTMNQVTNETPMNLSSLQKGIYMAKITDGVSEQTQKVILK